MYGVFVYFNCYERKIYLYSIHVIKKAEPSAGRLPGEGRRRDCEDMVQQSLECKRKKRQSNFRLDCERDVPRLRGV